MKILLIGKYPPIQGGVSAQTYLYARQLAEEGHDIFVVTNAREVETGYRMFMREEDWRRSEEQIGSGTLRVYWTDPPDRSQRHIPFHKAFFTKLFSLAASVAEEHEIDVVFSFYLEPYGVVGHAISREFGIPHVIKNAGSDLGRLWPHPQFRAAFDRVFRHAAMIWTASSARDELITRCGLEPERIHVGGRLVVPADLFDPEGQALDLIALQRDLVDASWDREGFVGTPPSADSAYIGMYGKISESKGTFDLVRALSLVENKQLDLLLMGGADAQTLEALRTLIAELGIGSRVVHIPFLPYWRVPEFIRRCMAVCCLERDFPIGIHNPVIAREVMLTGGRLVGSTEILRKLPNPERLIDGYNCYAVADVHDPRGLAEKISAATSTAARSHDLGKRARRYALGTQAGHNNVTLLEKLLHRAVRATRDPPPAPVTAPAQSKIDPAWLRTARLLRARAVDEESADGITADGLTTVAAAKEWLAATVTASNPAKTLVVDLAKVCLALAELPDPVFVPSEREFRQSVFRLDTSRHASERGRNFASDIKPFSVGSLRLVRLRHQAATLLEAVRQGELPARLEESHSALVIQTGSDGFGPKIFVVDAHSADIVSAAMKPACTDETDAVVWAEGISTELTQLIEMGLIGLGPRVAPADTVLSCTNA